MLFPLFLPLSHFLGLRVPTFLSSLNPILELTFYLRYIGKYDRNVNEDFEGESEEDMPESNPWIELDLNLEYDSY